MIKNTNTSKKAALVLFIDAALSVAALAVIVVLMFRSRDHATLLILAACLMIGHALVFYYEIKELLFPIRELEKLAAIVEASDLQQTKDDYDKRDAIGEGSELDRLINRVITALHNDYTSQMLKSQAEMHALQSQINPHFLYNTLETIRSHAISNQSTEIAEMTEALATLFRYSISQAGEMATFAQELENVQNYLLIQRYRFPEKFVFVKRIEEESVLSYKLPILTIQPIVENAIHHGLETKMGTGTITLRAFTTQDRLMIYIMDDGMGMSEGRLKEIQQAMEGKGSPSSGSKGKNMGIAMINVNQRIKFYFGSEYGLKVYSAPGAGTTVEISLPKKQS
ncbi:sensor histidine kinase [Youxingia wuxianensis]|uniref:Sensor histidine kinase n=1 Tax=Youxingia wuxianensis TaxID=2763678 RepID=A0A926ERS3_9FIRM|nr:sensor histidine kinase [Youxingia wuxianensis]MBC8585427.1 sensor histidine kinase [Youxingia wuxianensis]